MELPAAPLLETRGLRIVAGRRLLIDALDLALAPGSFVAVLGRNGTGKTLLLHTLAGLRPPAAGELRLGAAPLSGLSRREIARRLALLPQDSEAGQAATVVETVMLGRYAHAPLWGAHADRDHAAVREALLAADLDELANRDATTLSGGELRRTAMACVLAQAAPLMLLDEPTNHLDPHHGLLLLGAFAARVAAGAAVVATLHDPTLAARFATHALLLHGDGRTLFGPSDAVLGAGTLTALYGTPVSELRDGSRRVFVAS
jgi:iron complex transport system ATP-binding protein